MMRNIMLSQPETVLAHLSQNLRRHRLAAGLSQEELATRAGLSRRMVNGVEAGTSNISLTNLDHLANALGITFVDLVRPPQADSPRLETLVWQGASADSRAELLGAVPASRMVELWRWSLAPGDSYQAKPDAAGFHEMISVTRGTLRIRFDSEAKEIEAGGFLIFSSAQQYSYHNDGTETVHFVRNVSH